MDSTSAPSSATTAPSAKATASPQNPVFRMLGIPNIRPKLPSRNWLIFLSVTGSFTGSILYDRYQRKRATRKWCDAVSGLADETLPSNSMPRRVTIYLSAPPGDGMRPVREHFHDYIKPILVAGSMDWDVIEGKRQGDARWAAAKRIRRRRRKSEGHGSTDLQGEDLRLQTLEDQRRRAGTVDFDGPQGDLIVGRHTWKEYIRGLHEGWLGPLEGPKVEDQLGSSDASKDATKIDSANDGHAHSSLGDAAAQVVADTLTAVPDVDGASPQAADAPNDAPKQEEVPKPKNTKPDPYIATTAYDSAALTNTIPESLDPVTVLPFPHILGFLNTPTRMYRFLTRRYLADDIGRQTAALVLAAQTRRLTDKVAGSDDGVGSTSGPESLLVEEERDWPTKLRQSRDSESGQENVLLDPIVVDSRIAGRMSVWELSSHDDQPNR